MEQLIYYFSYISSGTLLTLKLLIGSFILGITLGLIIAVLNFNEKSKLILKNFISLIRGTPLILQLSFIYFITPTLFGIKLNILWAGIITFGLNSSVYIAEILRSGIENLPKGQFEAAKTLEISKFYMWKDIILPQVFKNISPAITNQIITLLKDTALISTIGGMDIMRSSQNLASEKFTYFMPLIIAAIYYYILVLIIEIIAKSIEKRGVYD